MTWREVVARLEKDGWLKARQKGSHAVYKHPDKPGRVVVPMHNGDLPAGTLRDILKKAGLQND